MVAAKKTEFMSGKIYWAKILGNPVPNYDGDAKEWTFEFEPDEAGVAILRKHKLEDRLKNKQEGRKPYLTLRKKALDYEGNPNLPIRVYDHEDNQWDASVLIGNGSEVDVKLDIRDYGVGKKKGIYTLAVRINEHVEYKSNEFGGMEKDNNEVKAPAKKQAPKRDFADDLNDDIPFDTGD